MLRRNDEKEVPLVSSVSAIGLFGRQNIGESKQQLIAKLNTTLINIHSQVKYLETGARKDSLIYLQSASSFEDPYQLFLMKKNVEEELAILKARYKRLMPGTLLLMGFSCLVGFIYSSESQSSIMQYSTGIGALSTIGTAIVQCTDQICISSQISLLNSMLNSINGAEEDNRKLSQLLDPSDPRELAFRNEFFDRFIKPFYSEEQTRRINAEYITQLNQGGMMHAEWNPSNGIIPTRVGYMTRTAF